MDTHIPAPAADAVLVQRALPAPVAGAMRQIEQALLTAYEAGRRDARAPQLIGPSGQRILDMLADGPMVLNDIARKIGTTPSNAWNFLQRQIARGCVVQLARGLYALPRDAQEGR